MPAPEADMESTEAGLAPASDGWFVVNVADAAGTRYNPRSSWVRFEGPDHRFPQYGVNIHVVEPDEPNGLYHEESDQEDFLVLSASASSSSRSRSGG